MIRTASLKSDEDEKKPTAPPSRRPSVGSNGGNAREAIKPMASTTSMTRSRSEKKAPTIIRSDDDALMDKLFGDDSRAERFFKHLINPQGLHSVWDRFQKRVTNLEDFTGSGQDKTTMTAEEFDLTFANRKDCREIADQEFRPQLTAHTSRLDNLEAAKAATDRRIEVDEKHLSEARSDLSAVWKLLQKCQQEQKRLDSQDNGHHKEALSLHEQLSADLAAQGSSFAAETQALRERLEEEGNFRLDLTEKFNDLHHFLYSEGLQKQLETICAEMLSHYVSWPQMAEESERIHNRAVDAATDPLRKEISTLRGTVEKNRLTAAAKDESIAESLLDVSEKNQRMDQRIHDRVDQVIEQVKLRAPSAKLAEAVDQLIFRDEGIEHDMSSFKDTSLQKMADCYDRISELEGSIHAHEHALEHWAEEIANRSTKYDVMVLGHKIDKCALKDRVESDYKEFQKTLHWQSVKLEKVAFNASFGREEGASTNRGSTRGGSVPAESASDGYRSGQITPGDVSRQGSVQNLGLLSRQASFSEGLPSAKSRQHSFSDHVTSPQLRDEANSPSLADDQTKAAGEAIVAIAGAAAEFVARVSRSPSPHLMNMNKNQLINHNPQAAMSYFHFDTEQIATIQSQLESLAHCVLGLAHAVFRGPMLGLSREARMDREDTLLHHAGCVSSWVTNRSVPEGWLASELTTIALQIVDRGETEKRRTGAARRSMWVSPQESSISSRSNAWEGAESSRRDMLEMLALDVQKAPTASIGSAMEVNASRRNVAKAERAERRQKQWAETGCASTTSFALNAASSGREHKASAFAKSAASPKRGARHLPLQPLSSSAPAAGDVIAEPSGAPAENAITQRLQSLVSTNPAGQEGAAPNGGASKAVAAQRSPPQRSLGAPSSGSQRSPAPKAALSAEAAASERKGSARGAAPAGSDGIGATDIYPGEVALPPLSAR